MTLLQLPPIKVWVSHTAVMKDGGTILLGFVRYFFLKSEATPQQKASSDSRRAPGNFSAAPCPAGHDTALSAALGPNRFGWK